MEKRCYSPGIFCLLILFYFSLQHKDSSKTTEELITTIPQVNEQTKQLSNDQTNNELNEISSNKQVIVDVKGAVKFPGVYQLTSEERVIDAITYAGGYLEEAETRYINHAQKLLDEMVIYIPKKGESLDEMQSIGQGVHSTSFDSNASPTSGKLVNLNTADETALSTLPGIGPSKAQAILAYRDENGSFKSIDELKNVSGIGEKTFEKLKDSIVVN
ncbi:helix-hairpin-helix domain-containing protein [Ureibacillus composti]